MKKKFTAKELADVVGCHIDNFRKYKKLQSRPRPERAKKLSLITGIPVDDFLFATARKNPWNKLLVKKNKGAS